MGKFDDALKKARAARSKSVGNPTSNKVVQIPREDIKALRLDTEALESPRPSPSVITARIDSRLVCFHEASSPAGECFKILRSKLMVGDTGDLRRAIMVTGAHPQDGKSLVAANLAVSIAQGINSYVLLVDCDLRRPSMHKIFGLRIKHGLREYIEDGTSVAPYLVKTAVQKLTLLPAGRPMDSPSEFLSSDKMRLLMQELKHRYKDRFIILDSPPAYFAADITSLLSVLDGVLLVVRSGKTPRQPLADVIEYIGREKILGLVLNASAEVQRDYRYYYNYYQSGKKK